MGRTDLPGASTDELYKSIDSLFSRIGPETRIYPGHGPATRADKERIMFL